MEITAKLHTGDILHCHTNRLLGRMISWFTKGWATHTATVVEVWGRTYIVDSQSDGTNARPLEAWLEKYDYDIIVARPNEEVNERKYSVKAFSKIGHTAYDYASLIFRHPWAIITKKWARDKDPNDKRMVCSEFVAWCYNIDKPYRITPKKIHDYTKRHDFTHYEYDYSA